jgi:hypothetical protein
MTEPEAVRLRAQVEGEEAGVISRQDAAFRCWDEVRSHEEQDGLQSEAALRGLVLPQVRAVPSIESDGSPAGGGFPGEAAVLAVPAVQERDGFQALLRALAE